MNDAESRIDEIGQIVGASADATDANIVEMVRNLSAENEQLRDLASRSWTIVHKRARVVLVGDLVASESGKTWHVADVETNAFETTITMSTSKGGLIERVTARDTAVPVLAPIPVRDGLVLLRGGLGAQLVPLDDPDEPNTAESRIAGAWREGQAHTCPLRAHPHVALRECVAYAIEHGDQRYVSG